MKVGTCVEWTSQAGGFKKVKRGCIAAVVPSGMSLNDCIKRENWSFFDGQYDCSAIDQRDYKSRNHESYLVVVAASVGSRRRPKLYWPRRSSMVEII